MSDIWIGHHRHTLTTGRDEMTITTSRLAVSLPLVGAAFLTMAILLPVELAIAAWLLAMLSFAAAVVCAIIVGRRRNPALLAVQQGGSK
ncbi:MULTISPECIES: hypothetical protein [unclassified Microbacterium]|uniref:hypothetical protein n=1 Tax=unclassified Microbacterium TaxID=2609290 RepID=UPI000EE6A1AA|nr:MULTISPECIES: hypothetical protein [unclassified Microbacterium]MBT2486447.1 hypothetical protein [Microbacterium sp. ISL-108]RKN69146.1 hypothetical protein D7252_17245 [Microbacterium sp. CGR2]